MTQLHTIEVRYEDTDGRHVDVHDAAEYRGYDDELCVYSGVCACCDATEETHRYNDHSLVKFSTEPSDHERVESEEDFAFIMLGMMLTVLAIVATSIVAWWFMYGGTVSL